MNQSNQIVLKMVLASPVGQALSDADRNALAQILETTDAREVQGWLGDQIRKAAAMSKGDFVGHPFRGNQYADASGASTGGASGNPRFGYGSGAKTSDLKEGDFVDIDTESSNFVGTILGIKDGVVSFDDVDKGEIRFKLKDVSAIDGDKVEEDDSAEAGRQRKKEIDAKLESARQGRERAAREEAAESSRRGKLIPVNDDNIDKTLKDAERKEFAQNVKEAKTAVKTTRALIDMLRQKVNEKATRSMLGSKRLDVVQANLQAAQEETDRFEDILNENSKASIRSAVAISAMGTDVGETVKGFIRESAQLMRVDIPARDEAALQTAADKNYGVSGDKYDVESVYDQL